MPQMTGPKARFPWKALAHGLRKISAAGGSGSLVARGMRAGLKEEHVDREWVQATIDHMPHGLIVFDRHQRIVLWNCRYIELYGIPPEIVKAGLGFRDLLLHRREAGSLSADVDEYHDSVVTSLSEGRIAKFISKTRTGRFIQVINTPLPGGGWLATHDDVTEQQGLIVALRRAENAAQDQKSQLDAALNNMAHGVCMYNEHGIIVLFNRRYRELMDEEETFLQGLPLLDLLKHRRRTGAFLGDPESFYQSLLRSVRAGEITVTEITKESGIVLRVVHHPMDGGGWVATFEDVSEQRQIAQERDRTRQFLDCIIENIPVPVFVKDAKDRRFLFINRAGEKFWGMLRSQLIGRTADHVYPVQQAARIAARDTEALNTGESFWDEREVQTPGNGVRVASSRLLTVPGVDGTKYLIGVFDDVTERKRLESERDRNAALLNAILEHVPVTIFAKEPRERRYVFVNRAAEALWGVPRDAAIGKTAYDLFPKSAADLITARDDELLEQKHQLFHIIHQVEMPGNSKRLVNSTRVAILDDEGQPQYLLGVIEDVTERAKADDRIKYMAHHDILTGLSNRALFLEKMDEAIDRLNRCSEAFSVLMVDLDRFKEINDTLGHDAGDQLLMEIASRLKDSLRENDVVARLGGDEFAVIQTREKDQLKAATALANRIVKLVAEPFDVNGSYVTVGASIGISLAPIHGHHAGDLLKKADLALYQAKAEGRNCYNIFDSELAVRADARHILERELRAAIMTDDIVVHYQPIVDIQSRRARNRGAGPLATPCSRVRSSVGIYFSRRRDRPYHLYRGDCAAKSVCCCRDVAR